jgi:cytochrome P450/ferredoxin-NADP reductase
VGAPVYDVDFYSDEFKTDPWAHYAEMRRLGAVVWLPRHRNFALTRYKEVAAGLRDHDTFISGRGVAGDEAGSRMMRGNAVGSDGERHHQIRKAIAPPLLPGAMRDIEETVQALADALIADLVQRTSFDIMRDLAPYLPLTVVRDLVGVPDFAKDKMLLWANAAFDLVGIQNERGRQALDVYSQQREYLRVHATRDALKAGSWTRRIYELVDSNKLSAELAAYAIRDYINPSLDTTISATAQMVIELARTPAALDQLRANPKLIRNAVSEAVRLASPIRSFSRVAAKNVSIDGVDIPAGARVMMLYASANRDEAKFERPDCFDVTRPPTEHMGFGSGIHMCVGMHLAQLEMTALLRAMLARVGEVTVLSLIRSMNNTMHSYESVTASFAALSDPQRARALVSIEQTGSDTNKSDHAHARIRAHVRARTLVAEDIVELTLSSTDTPLPRWSPGAHIDVHIDDDTVRQYSLTGQLDEPRYRIAVLRDPHGKGGSTRVHDEFPVGSVLDIGRPRNNFPVTLDSKYTLLFSGGIGLTPILPMAWYLHAHRQDFVWHISARTWDSLPYGHMLPNLPFADRLLFHISSAGTRLDPRTALAGAQVGEIGAVQVCGPQRYMDSVRQAALAAGLPPERIHEELFGREIDADDKRAFRVVAQASGKSFNVDSTETILDALRREGIEVPNACRNGVCGSCVTTVLSGVPAHRDMVLTEAEKRTNTMITVCCSRALSSQLHLDI